MKNSTWPILFLVFLLVSCREESSSDAITKPELRKQLESLQAPSEEAVVQQFEDKDEAFKEKILDRVLGGMDDEKLKKVMNKPRFKELMAKLLEASSEKIKESIKELTELETKMEEDLKVKVEKKIGLNRNSNFAFVDPYLSYNFRSSKRKYSCEDFESTQNYWTAFLKFKNDDLKMGLTHAALEQVTKSCLFYFHFRASMDECQFTDARELAAICELKPSED